MKKYKFDELKDEEHIAIALASLFRCLAATPTDDGLRYSRLQHKFAEGEFEKVDRLMELYEKYTLRTRAAEARVDTERRERFDLYEDYDPADDEDEFLAMRLEGGLFTLQLLSLITGFLATSAEQPQVRAVLPRAFASY